MSKKAPPKRGRNPAHPEGVCRFLGVTVPLVLLERLEKKAAKAGKSVSCVVTEAIRRCLK